MLLVCRQTFCCSRHVTSSPVLLVVNSCGFSMDFSPLESHALISAMATSDLKILLVGKGAREHSLAWKLSQSPSVQHIYVVPGNGGTQDLPNVSNISHIGQDDFPGLVCFARDQHIGLVVAGPDDAVVNGIAGYFEGSTHFTSSLLCGMMGI